MAAPLTHTPPFQVMQYTTREEDGNAGDGGGGGTGAGMLGQDANYAGMSVCRSLIQYGLGLRAGAGERLAPGMEAARSVRRARGAGYF